MANNAKLYIRLHRKLAKLNSVIQICFTENSIGKYKWCRMSLVSTCEYYYNKERKDMLY